MTNLPQHQVDRYQELYQVAERELHAFDRLAEQHDLEPESMEWREDLFALKAFYQRVLDGRE